MANAPTCQRPAGLSPTAAPEAARRPARRAIDCRAVAGRAAGALVAGLGAGGLLLAPAPAWADAASAELFTKSCAGCHAGGGNIVQRTATLRKEDLQRNGAASPEAIYNLIYAGKGKMPGYGENCAPKGKCTFAKRLSDEQVRGLTQYVLDQAERGWQE